MNGGNSRPKELGLLIVVGGFGGSGSSTIAKMLANHYSLSRVYAGGVKRDMAKVAGFASIEDFLIGMSDEQMEKIDREVDNKMMKFSYNPNVLVEGKMFAALATKYRIPTTVKIWLDCDIDVRAKRKALVDGTTVDEMKSRLQERYELDNRRFSKTYNIKYDMPKRYNDIVLNITKLNEFQTLSLILKLIKDGGYIK